MPRDLREGSLTFKEVSRGLGEVRGRFANLQRLKGIFDPLWMPQDAATPVQRGNWRLIGNGIGIHWPLLDEDVSVATVLSAE